MEESVPTEMLMEVLNQVMLEELEGSEQKEIYLRTMWNMTNHTPSPERIKDIEELRGDFKVTAGGVILRCPPSRERSLALTHLEQALMWAVAGIAREEIEEVSG